MSYVHAILTSDIFMAGLVAAFFAAIAALPTFLVRFWKLLGRRLSAADIELLTKIATASVTAVEQQMKKAENQEKLATALDQARKSLATYGVKVSDEQLRNAIESAWFLAKSNMTLPPPPVEPITNP